MSQEELQKLLSNLSGHLRLTTPEDTANFETLQDKLASTFIDEKAPIRNTAFTFERSDLLIKAKIPRERFEKIGSLAKKMITREKEPESQVFVREVPVRSTQIVGSVPDWAAGAAIDKTIGPFINEDGRKLWFDFYKIEKLVALYIQGKSDPALLFNISTLSKVINGRLPRVSTLAKNYQLKAGSIWIHSQILAPGAPAGNYTGLKITGGEVILSVAPKMTSDKLTIAANTIATVSLNLPQPEISDADANAKYGVDARDMGLTLPAKLQFRFTGSGGQIIEAAPAKWEVLGDQRNFTWPGSGAPSHNTLLNRILIPYQTSPENFSVKKCQSHFNATGGEATVKKSAWALPLATINISQPPAAAGIGAMAIESGPGLSVQWKGLNGGKIKLTKPWILAEPGRINITDPGAGENVSCRQQFTLWKDDQNPFASTIKVKYLKSFPFVYNTLANGTEIITAKVDANPQTDRPVTVTGNALDIHSKNSGMAIAVTSASSFISLFDDNIIADHYNPKEPSTFPRPIAFAMHNAVFTTTPANTLMLIGELDEDFVKVKKGSFYLNFGMYSYLPTLPDPYTANLGLLKGQFIQRDTRGNEDRSIINRPVRLWLVCLVKWEPASETGKDAVNVSFHFAPLQNDTSISSQPAPPAGTSPSPFNIQANDKLEQFLTIDVANAAANEPIKDMVKRSAKRTVSTRTALIRTDLEKIWDDTFRRYTDDAFALLDVSSNANQFGVSFASFGRGRFAMMATHTTDTINNNPVLDAAFPLQVQGMDVVSPGLYAKAFTVPQISWEPVLNLTDPAAMNPSNPSIEPPMGPNYYPNDGGPTRILNNSVQMVPLAPIPLTNFIIDKFANEKGNTVASLFTLPFGMKAIAVLNKEVDTIPPKISNNRHNYPNDIQGGIQLRFTAGLLSTDRFPMFHGGTLQLNNILNAVGTPTFTGTLGDSVSFIFNEEFVPKMEDLVKSRGVPLTRIDFSGYGASIFSNWFNPDAQFAQTSQAKFDVFVGRTAHEVIQVRSMIYPWGIRVVRTIILYRSGSGYVYRVDTGWKAESDGIYDFTYKLRGHADFPAPPANVTDRTKIITNQSVYNTHPGIVKGLFKIENIVEQGNKFPLANSVAPGEYYVDENNNVVKNTSASPLNHPAMVKAVEFDCDVEIEGVEEGASNGRVPSKKMRGFVQLAPMGTPLSKNALRLLHESQGGSIGGPVDCLVDIGKNGQKIRVHRIDSNASINAAGNEPVFVAAARGNVILPKDGSWTLISHEYSSGDVTPLPANTSVPVIRISQLKANEFTDPANPEIKKYTLKYDPDPATQLLRIAHPQEILRNETNGTINFGFLQNTDTQKILFLTPSYKKLNVATEVAKLMSKTPPLFTDAYHMMSSKGIFPNIGNAVDNFGDAIPLLTNFAKSTLTDAGKQVFELMQINQKDIAGAIEKEGYKLLKQVEDFEFPLPSEIFLINEDFLKIYVEYKTTHKDAPPKSGNLKYDINSFANNVADNWKSKMSNISMVLDMGPFERLMTIKGNFDSKKGAEAGFKGSDTDPAFPAPQIEFSPVLETVMDILQILQDLQGAKYGDALKKGLKIAMSNNAGSWEYKFEASKEIPVVKFPIPDAVYNAPTTPLKLEAGLKIGVYFNGAIMVTTEPGKLIPTAGAYIDFYGRLSVMCVSLAAATIYAVGQVNLGIAADTKKGPSLTMKFGFGAQIVVGLPVVANVSVLYMVGVEIYADSTTIIVTASMLFQGHADLLGGIVSITITIEAKGSVKRVGDRTDCSAQVTFAIEISIFLVIDIDFSTSWEESRQIA